MTQRAVEILVDVFWLGSLMIFFLLTPPDTGFAVEATAFVVAVVGMVVSGIVIKRLWKT